MLKELLPPKKIKNNKWEWWKGCRVFEGTRQNHMRRGKKEKEKRKFEKRKMKIQKK